MCLEDEGEGEVVATLKEKVDEICNEVSAEFPGWEFRDGYFKKGILKKCDLVISGGFAYKNFSTCLKPSVKIDHKPSNRLCKEIVGFAYRTSILGFDAVEGFRGHFKPNWNNGLVVNSRYELFLAAPEAKKHADRYIDISDARPVMRAMLQDGITLLDRYYDQTSEDSLLSGLPPKYQPHYRHDDPPGLNGTSGIAACIAHIYVGDFEFFEWYRSDACKTIAPKKVSDLNKIAIALPELKRRFGRSGR
jgi:hypothetical protein